MIFKFENFLTGKSVEHLVLNYIKLFTLGMHLYWYQQEISYLKIVRGYIFQNVQINENSTPAIFKPRFKPLYYIKFVSYYIS